MPSKNGGILYKKLRIWFLRKTVIHHKILVLKLKRLIFDVYIEK
jgi:hypothetical protein